ncbi:hypothetical protein E4U57_005906 [Claviceps arundinis]|uniref:Uncharacterized protein n=1 Tax=Claviceps arundinis TaxID=1623583 RepID=A0A9P7SMA4_9HYPO|nr:hypothetical protein E4U57_005906 [Claviceps arundinis]KAG5964267.1 hypothetical protein E4U56_002344 [Claviceps arundinis]
MDSLTTCRTGSLNIPQVGVHLRSTGVDEEYDLPSQGFVLTLNDDIVEQLMRSHEREENIEIQLGKTPTLLYGSHSFQIPRDDQGADGRLAGLDLYLTKPFQSSRTAERVPSSAYLFNKTPSPRTATGPKKAAAQTSKREATSASKEVATKKKPAVSSRAASSTSLKSDIETLQNGLAAHDAARDRARVVGKLPTGGKGRGKLLCNSYVPSASKAMSTSPAVKPTSAPQITATQQVMERKKEQRSILVHELALAAQTTEQLKSKWTGKDEDFQSTLEKTAQYDAASRKWTMKQPWWKELNVWNYNYATQDDRQTVIDNAVRQYDRLRLSASEKEWQLLLPKAERGKGKCLSRLQANIAKGPPQQASKTKVHKTDDTRGTKDDAAAGSPNGDKPKAGGESLSQSKASSLPAKAKKPTGQETQPKKLLSNARSKTTAAKTSPSKPKQPSAKVVDKNDKRVLSAAIVENSDSSEGEAPAAKSKPAARKAKDTVVVATRPSAAPREPAKKQQAVKRPRDDSDSSSSSGTPLSKRIKATKQALPAPKPRAQATKATSRSQAARLPSSAYGSKNKSTCPRKSSPLASSPPTNASDLEDEETPPASNKRKAEVEGKPTTGSKRRAVENVPADVLNKAHKFKICYQKYQALHYEIEALDDPPREKVANLVEMRSHLEVLKKDIYNRYSSHRDQEASRER